ncbi:MAG: GNAT family N-acetyltransferase [Bdellovibrionaceae bacterium]|nr:GNAT family N-acetyltransferase [Pseudobdellovibrionaceae bacterium]
MSKEQISKKGSIGILAGMGPRSTAPFINLVFDECQKQYGAKDDIDFPKIMIYSLPTPFYANRPTDHSAMQLALQSGLNDLEKTGVSFIAMACNTAHAYYSELAPHLGVPFLDMVDLTLKALPKSKRKMALIAARPTVESELYQKGIINAGHEYINMNWQSQVDALIESVKTSKDPLFFKTQWAKLLVQTKNTSVDTVLIACLDLSAIIEHFETDLLVLDSSRCLAAGLIEHWLKPTENAKPGEWTKDNFTITTDKKYLQVDQIQKFLSTAYWSLDIPSEVVKKAAENSICFGVYDHLNDRAQIGYARVVTDKSTFAWLCDVYIDPKYRGMGLSKWLIECVIDYPELKGLRRICLATKDAQRLYAKYGFQPADAGSWMEIKINNIYQKEKIL